MLIGLAGMLIVGATGFEEPAGGLLVSSLLLALATPAAMLLHLAFTKELTWPEKRMWLQELAGSRALRVFAAYLTCADRRAFTRRLVETRR
jgi:hypothetical protein